MKQYRIDISGYRQWYQANVRSGAFMFEQQDIVTVGSINGEKAFDVKGVNTCIGVYDMPARFLIPVEA